MSELNTSGYSLKLHSIGSDAWQLFLTKLDDSSDFARVVYGITEQAGGASRSFRTLRSYIIVPLANDDPVFVMELSQTQMKNRRVWVAFQTVKRVKGKRGKDVATFVALSPAQSKWRTRIGSATELEIRPLDMAHFQLLYRQDEKLPDSVVALLAQG